MFNAQQLEAWLNDVARFLEAPCSIYLIGGCAMCFKELKSATKDVDAIVTTKQEFEALDSAITRAGFKKSTDMEGEFYFTALAVYEKGDSRIDVFLKEVGKMLKFTGSMKQRANLHRHIGNMKVYTASNEDIFLFKAMTPGQRDVDDCVALIRAPLNYEAILEECISQSREEHKWYFWLYEKLCTIEESSGTESPIKGKVYQAVKEGWKDRPSDFMNEMADLEKHIPDKKLAEELKNGGVPKSS